MHSAMQWIRDELTDAHIAVTLHGERVTEFKQGDTERWWTLLTICGWEREAWGYTWLQNRREVSLHLRIIAMYDAKKAKSATSGHSGL